MVPPDPVPATSGTSKPVPARSSSARWPATSTAPSVAWTAVVAVTVNPFPGAGLPALGRPVVKVRS